MLKVYLFLALISVHVLIVDSFAFGALGGGGGGGCGGGCGGGGGGCAPAVGGCGGGCGRKKRSVLEPQIRTETNELCPQTEWKEAMDSNLSESLESSKYAIQGQLYRQFEHNFFVMCSPAENKKSLGFISNGIGYCISGNEKLWCAAVLMMG